MLATEFFPLEENIEIIYGKTHSTKETCTSWYSDTDLFLSKYHRYLIASSLALRVYLIVYFAICILNWYSNETSKIRRLILQAVHSEMK